jgi:streptogramin lyase
VWITNGFGTPQGADGSVMRLDPQGHEIVPAFDTPIGSRAITWGADAVWVANPGTASVTRYDPAQQVSDTFPLSSSGSPPEPDAIAFGVTGGDAIWVGDRAHDQIFRMDANDPRSVRTSLIGGPASAITVGSDAIFVASETTDAVFVLDPRTGGGRTSFDVGASGCNAPSAIDIAGGSVWVACSLSREVVRLDPTTGTVLARFHVDGAPDALVTDDDGSVWVAVRPE